MTAVDGDLSKLLILPVITDASLKEYIANSRGVVERKVEAKKTT